MFYVDKKGVTRVYSKGFLSEDEWVKQTERRYDTTLQEISEKEYHSLNNPSLEEIREKKLHNINASCEVEIVSGFYSSALGSEHFYHSTIEEQSNLNSLIMLGIDNQFKAQAIEEIDGVKTKGTRQKYQHTIQQLKDVLIDAATRRAEIIQKKDDLMAQINAEDMTFEELEEIEW